MFMLYKVFCYSKMWYDILFLNGMFKNIELINFFYLLWFVFFVKVVWVNLEYVGCVVYMCLLFIGFSLLFNGGIIVVCNYGLG